VSDKVSDKTQPVILAVDDATDMLALIEKALGDEYQVLTAADPGTAIEKAFGEPRPDLILLDVDMPEIGGFEVCRALKDEPTTSSIPIVFLTGRNEAEAQIEGLQLGAADYISKASTNAAVLKTRVALHRALAGRRAELVRLVQERTEQLTAPAHQAPRVLGFTRAMISNRDAAELYD
jgi:PleD family two-component response regulator